MNILFIDLETNSLSCEEGDILEIASVLYCTDAMRVINSVSFIINEGAKTSSEIYAINKISQEVIEKYGVPLKYAFHIIENDQLPFASFLCGHNSGFDRGFIEVALKELGKEKWGLPWLDTCVDIKFPKNIATRKLSYLAAEHNFINPFPHSALSDTLTCCKLFSNYSAEDIINRGKSPNIHIRALVDYANREKASRRGFRWEPVSKKWLKNIKKEDLEEEKKSLDFEIQVLE